MSVRGPALAAPAAHSHVVRAWPPVVLSDAARTVAFALVALGAGWLCNGLRRQPLAWSYHSPAQRLQNAVGRLQSPAPRAEPSPSTMDLAAFQAFVVARQGIVIDARSEDFYRLGHVPGAINLARETFARDYDARKAALDPHRTGGVAVYCSEAECPDAELVAEAMARLGFQPLWVYRAGWEEWTEAGLPQEGVPNL